jgi:hypothetical protein
VTRTYARVRRAARRRPSPKRPPFAPPARQVLTKALLPLPDKWHGLADVEKRYRQRYLDLIVSEGTRATFRARSRIISTIRRLLEERDFLEVGREGRGRRCNEGGQSRRSKAAWTAAGAARGSAHTASPWKTPPTRGRSLRAAPPP